MKTGHWDLNNITSKNLTEVATLRIRSIKILSMRYIKLAQMTPGSQNFSFLAHKAEAVGVTQICANDGGNGDGNDAWQTDFFIAQIMLFIHKKS
jgi:hypothetical protein